MAFAIVATFEFQEGDRVKYLPALLRHRERCLKDEPGTLQFDVLSVNDDENKLMLYEVYTDPAAFDTHWNGQSIELLQAETKGIELKLSGVRCTRVEGATYRAS